MSWFNHLSWLGADSNRTRKRSWFRQLFTVPGTRTIRKAPRRVRLALGALEDRFVPSAVPQALLHPPHTFTVNSTAATTATGTLLWAVGQANSTSGADIINFDPTVFKTMQTIALNGTELELSNSTGTQTITGPPAGVTISGGGLSRVFQIDSNVTASISGVTITGGAAAQGGGIYSSGTLTITNSTLTHNNAGGSSVGVTAGGGGGSGQGGGLFVAAGTVTLTGDTLTHNTAMGGTGSGHSGGPGGTGQGGGLFVQAGTVILTDDTVSANLAEGGDGGSGASGFNSSPGGSGGNGGNGQGGGLYVQGGSVTLTADTLALNTALGGFGGPGGQGGTLNNNGPPGTDGSGQGGGLYAAGFSIATAAIQPLIFVITNVGLVDTLVADNSAGNSASDVAGTVAGHTNLIGTGGSGGLANGVNGNIVLTSLTNLGLAPLGNYGGPTQTMALLPGSAAIDAGASGTGIPTTDQRGLGDIGGVDIGSVQSQGYTLTPATGSTPQTASPGAAFANPLAVTVTPNDPNDPVNGGVVTFTAPAAGPSANLSASSVTIAGGSASVTATANFAVGAYTVTATASGAAAGASFKLTNNALVSIAVSPSNPSRIVGQTEQFTATGTFGDGSTQNLSNSVTWVSATPSVATINSTGLASTLTVGKTVITASLGGITSPNDTLTVTQAAPHVVAIDKGGPFNGKPYPASGSATGIGGKAVSGTFTFTYKDSHNNTLAGAPTSVGTYTVVASFTSTNPNYKNGTSVPLTFSITPGPSGPITTDGPTFAWSPVAGATHYTLTITQGSTVTLSLTNIVATTHALTSAQALTPGQSYAWSVTAFNAKGTVLGSSSKITFHVLPLAAPTRLVFTSASDTFSWQAVTDAGHYSLKVVDNASGTAVINVPDVAGTKYKLTSQQAGALVAGHNYTWFVTAVSSNGKASVPSAGAKFTM